MAFSLQLTPQPEISADVPVDLARTRQPQYGRYLDELEPGQVFEQPMTESQLPQALAFLTGTGKLADDFAFRLLNAKKQGYRKGHVLELRPKRSSPHYDRIIFYVDSDPSRAGLVHRVLIVDPEGCPVALLEDQLAAQRLWNARKVIRVDRNSPFVLLARRSDNSELQHSSSFFSFLTAGYVRVHIRLYVRLKGEA